MPFAEPETAVASTIVGRDEETIVRERTRVPAAF
jgi:hypothetical protein